MKNTEVLLKQLKKNNPSKKQNAGILKRKPLTQKESLTTLLIQWGTPVTFFLGATMAMVVVSAVFDFDWAHTEVGFLPTILTATVGSVNDAIGSFIELLAANLGIMITVVAIVLQLAAQRYGTRLIDLFLADRINRAYFFFMVVNLLFAIVITFIVKDNFFPFWAIQLLLFFTLLEIALLAPYFLYVFKFLTPTNLLSAIQETNKESIKNATLRKNYPFLSHFQKECANSLEQVTDTALSANSQMDRNLGLMAISQVKEMVLDCQELKAHLPKIWFSIPKEFFVGISSEFHEEICEQKLWFEAKAFMDMELIFKTCIKTMPDAISAIALNTRVIGEMAIKKRDNLLLDMVVKFYNTFIRIALNDLNIRAVFNLYYQYMLLTESIFDYNPKLSQNIAFYFKYYGEIGLQKGISFVLYNAAFDLGSLVAKAYDKKLPNIKAILLTFMELEDNIDKEKDFFALSGVRKSQLILATYLLSKGDKDLLPIIAEDLKNESFDFLIKLRDMLLDVKDRKYWEITDRGYNFEYIDDTQKEYLKLFYDKYILSHKEDFN